MRAAPEFKRQLEDIRREWPHLPSAAEVIHQLVEREWKRLERKKAKD